MEYSDFMIEYSLFLINEFNYERNEAALNAQSWWDYFNKNNERIVGFRINKNGKPSIQTKKYINIEDSI